MHICEIQMTPQKDNLEMWTALCSQGTYPWSHLYTFISEHLLTDVSRIQGFHRKLVLRVCSITVFLLLCTVYMPPSALL